MLQFRDTGKQEFGFRSTARPRRTIAANSPAGAKGSGIRAFLPPARPRIFSDERGNLPPMLALLLSLLGVLREMPVKAGAVCRWSAAALMAVGISPGLHAQSIDELRDMSIDALANLDVTSVTKSAGTLGDAPAAIYVITHDDIVRSGTLTLPGILRIAPNLQIARGGGDLDITARGLGGNEMYQSFSNKLQVMIDGRSVYSPLYSGVFWDMQDVLPEDIDRIEVISGPGATLWGSNAVNGVINIITRNTGASQGLYGTGVIGNRTYDAGLRYGGRAGDSGNYRIFLKRHENFETEDNAGDGSHRTQGGFRADWTPSGADTLTVQGDGYVGHVGKRAAPHEDYHGYDLLARWTRATGANASLQVQAYYDHVGRDIGDGQFGRFAADTFDGEVQHGFALGSSHRIVWGGGMRAIRYLVENVPGLAFLPSRRTLFSANLFAQDSISLTPSLTAIVGLKLEEPAFAGVTPLPSVRLSWKASPATLLWASVSRAIRAPTPFDRDTVERDASGIILAARESFRSEKLVAYEAGTRLTLSARASLSVSGFFNDYEDLRSIEFDPTATTGLPLYWGNGIEGHSYGFDAWADLRPTDWWRIKPGYSLLIQRFRFAPDALPFGAISQAGNDPTHRASIRSSMDIGREINLDADLRFVSALPDPFVPSYFEAGARIGWQFHQNAELSVSGFNLLHDRHQELPAAYSPAAGRSVFVALKWTM